MKNNQREPFVPFSVAATPPTPGFQDLRLMIVSQAEKAQPFRPAAAAAAPPTALLPDFSSACSAGGEHRITLHREGDRVTRISVQCTCGQVIDLACVY